MSQAAPEYVAARSVLLDALGAMGPHRETAVLVGAQAVYVHAGSGELTLALMTTDSDLVLRTAALAPDPDLAAVLTRAGFAAGPNPGMWCGRGDVRVDLMVVPHESNRTGASARSARLPGHDNSVARITRGLEPALVDHEPQTITALNAIDERSFTLRVAGPAALIAAKAIKIDERLQDKAAGGRDRLRSKDALDVFRLLQAVELHDLVEGFARHAEEAHAHEVSQAALAVLRAHGTQEAGLLPQLAGADLLGEDWVPEAFASLCSDLVDALA